MRKMNDPTRGNQMNLSAEQSYIYGSDEAFVLNLKKDRSLIVSRVVPCQNVWQIGGIQYLISFGFSSGRLGRLGPGWLGLG